MDVVTGAGGFLGGAVVDALLAQGRRVRVVVRQRRPDRWDGAVERAEADVRDGDAITRALHGADRVFHCAGRVSIRGDPDGQVHAINVLGARNVARAAAGARVVHVSSVHAFALHGPTVSEESPRPGAEASAYDRSKVDGEEEMRGVAVIVNPTAIFGPGDEAPSRMGDTVARLAGGLIPALVDGGFDWVDVRDVAAGIVAAADRGRVGENYLLGGEQASVRRIAELIHAAGGAPPPRWSVPRSLAWSSAPLVTWVQDRLGQEPIFTQEGLGALWTAVEKVSWDKAARELDYRPRPLAETVADTVRWFRARSPR